MYCIRITIRLHTAFESPIPNIIEKAKTEVPNIICLTLFFNNILSTFTLHLSPFHTIELQLTANHIKFLTRYRNSTR